MNKLEKIQRCVEKGKERPLLKLAQDSDKEVKLAAIEAMGRVGNDESFNAIVPDMLIDSDPDIRAAAALALGVMKNNHASAHLRYYLEREKDPKVADALKEAINNLGGSD